MESLTEILLLPVLDNKIKNLKTRNKNYVRYDDQISKFSYLIDFNDNFPILKGVDFNGRICFIEWIVKEDVVYLSLNCVYRYDGVLSYIECLTKDGNVDIINNGGNLKTFSGKRFKSKIDVENISKVDVFLVDKFIVKG